MQQSPLRPALQGDGTWHPPGFAIKHSLEIPACRAGEGRGGCAGTSEDGVGGGGPTSIPVQSSVGVQFPSPAASQNSMGSAQLF